MGNWVLSLEAFISLFQAEILGEVLGQVVGRGFQGNIHQFLRCAQKTSELWSPLIGQWQGRESLVIAAGPGVTHLVLLPFGPGAKTQLRPRCYL